MTIIIIIYLFILIALLRLQIRSMRRARDVREQLAALCERAELQLRSAPGDVDALGRAVTAGFFFHAAKLQRDGSYRSVKSRHTVYVHPSSVLAKTDVPPKWIVFYELVETSKEYMRQVLTIKPEWLVEVAPHYYKGACCGRRRMGALEACAHLLASTCAHLLASTPTHSPLTFLSSQPRTSLRMAPARCRTYGLLARVGNDGLA